MRWKRDSSLDRGRFKLISPSFQWRLQFLMFFFLHSVQFTNQWQNSAGRVKRHMHICALVLHPSTHSFDCLMQKYLKSLLHSEHSECNIRLSPISKLFSNASPDDITSQLRHNHSLGPRYCQYGFLNSFLLIP